MSWYDREKDQESPAHASECHGSCEVPGYVEYAQNRGAELKVVVDDGAFVFCFRPLGEFADLSRRTSRMMAERTPDADPESLLLTDFESRRLSWTTVNDDVMGGRSKGGFEIEDGTLVFRGATNTDGGGFSSIRTSPEQLGLQGHEAIRLRVRGDGRTYTFRLDTGSAQAVYWAEFATSKDEWTEVRLPIDSFVARWRGRVLGLPAPDPAEVIAIGFMIYDKLEGPFRLEVDWIRADSASSIG